MLEKVFGVVILYNPAENTPNNILSYKDAVDHLIVIDNSERPHAVRFEENEHLTFFSDGRNRGIAERLNQAAAFAKTQNAQWLLTMDQDSSFKEDMLDRYLGCVASFRGKDKVAMFGVAFDDSEQEQDCRIEDVESLITSGSLVNLDLFERVGSFDEKLFIDDVDFDYCVRSINTGFRIVKFKNVCMQHQLGTVYHRRSLKNFKMTSRTFHSPLRLYYMLRNYLYLRDKYVGSMPEVFRIKRTDLLNRVKNQFLYGNARVEMFRYLLAAYRHYKAGKMGKYQ